VVIGGQAEALMGSYRNTEDIDVCHRLTPASQNRLLGVLQTFEEIWSVAPPAIRCRFKVLAYATGGMGPKPRFSVRSRNDQIQYGR